MNVRPKDKDLDLLYEAFLRIKTKDECKAFLEDLCTIQELKAFCQRMEVAQLLTAGEVYSDIVDKTSASTATISRVNRSLNYGSNGYNVIFERLKKDNLI